MGKKRTKIYKAGDKIQVSLSKDLSPEFLEWINKQSDLTNFFLFGVKKLYEEYGNIDIVNVMPRKIDISDISSSFTLREKSKTFVEHSPANIIEPKMDNKKEHSPTNVIEPKIDYEKNDDVKNEEKWSSLSLNNFKDDPFS